MFGRCRLAVPSENRVALSNIPPVRVNAASGRGVQIGGFHEATAFLDPLHDRLERIVKAGGDLAVSAR